MTKETLNYNIHDILRFRIIRERQHAFRDLINLKFSWFQVDDMADKPDIVLNIGKFAPSNQGCYLVDHKYHIKDNYFFCRDSEGKAKWMVEVSGLERGDMVVNFDVRSWGSESIINPDLLPQSFLLKLLEYKLNEKGCALLHAAAVARNGRACLLAGRGGSFKTTLCMDFVRRASFDFLGDDRVVLRVGEVLSFPRGYRVFDFMTRHLATEKSWSLANKIRFFNYLRSDRNGATYPRSAALKAVLLVTPSRRAENPLRFQSIDPGESVARLVFNNRLEDFVTLSSLGIGSAPFLKYMMGYSLVFPDSRVSLYESDLHRNLAEILAGVPVYQVEIPPDYDLKVFDAILEFSRGLVDTG